MELIERVTALLLLGVDAKLDVRKTQRMHFGRVSEVGARYFVTLCTANRDKTLCSLEIADRIFEQLEVQHDETDFELSCATLMPDHLHFVFRLGERLMLGRAISKFKAKTKDAVSWQKDFFDHRIRLDESEEEYAFYIFMNPYVEGLLGMGKRWDFWKRWRNVPYRFEDMLERDGRVPQAWVKLADEKGGRGLKRRATS